MTMQTHKPKNRAGQHTAYLSPTDNFTGANLERDDRHRYRRAAEASEQLRRAMMRYYFKRNGVRL